MIELLSALDIAKRTLTVCGQIFRFAIVGHGLAERNPATDIKPFYVVKATRKNAHLLSINRPFSPVFA
ncbi:hypothetical protein [Nitrosomonas supralitoralis]|uniref:hypothetical protein n=1 Tax=Nitrosomonas supralitoralis TaxID=2116706 RepID=UPI0011C41892|nr:hypothetical protein [Nitrosomonas supralitoralis]